MYKFTVCHDTNDKKIKIKASANHSPTCASGLDSYTITLNWKKEGQQVFQGDEYEIEVTESGKVTVEQYVQVYCRNEQQNYSGRSQPVVITLEHLKPIITKKGDVPDVCVFSAPFKLNVFQETGIYSGPGVTDNTFSPSVAGSGNHIITFRTCSIGIDGTECCSEETFTIHVDADFTISHPDVNKICLNAGILQLNQGSPSGGTYKGQGVTSLGEFNPSVAGVGIHTLTYQVKQGTCMKSIDFKVDVKPIPNVTLPNISFCEGEGEQKLTHGSPSGGIYTGNYITDNNFNVSNAGVGIHDVIYTVTNLEGCSSVKENTIEVKKSAKVTLELEPNEFCKSTGLADLKGGYPENGTYSGNLVSNNKFNTDAAETGNHIIRYTYIEPNTGCIGTFEDVLTLNENPVLKTLPALEVCKEEQFELGLDNMVESGGGGYDYDWKPTNLIDKNDVKRPKGKVSQNTVFSVEVIDGNGCKISGTQEVKVKASPAFELTSDTTICKGENIQLWATANNNFTYVWSPTNGLDNPNISNPTASPSKTTNYILLITDKTTTCSDEKQVVVAVSDIEAESGVKLESIDICFGEIAQLEAYGGTSYFWSPDNAINNRHVNNPIVNPSESIKYNVRIQNEYNCFTNREVEIEVNRIYYDAGDDLVMCKNDTVKIGKPNSQTGDYQYEWEPKEFLNDPFIAEPLAFPNTNIEYEVKITDSKSGCKISDKIKLEVREKPNLTLSTNDSMICRGDTTTLTCSGASTYIWTPSTHLTDSIGAIVGAYPLQTTKYHVKGTSGTGCIAETEIVVHVSDGTGVRKSEVQACFGEIVQLEAFGGEKYYWSPPNGLDDPFIARPKATIEKSIKYSVSITNGFGCEYSHEVNILTNKLFFDAGIDTGVCQGTVVKIGKPNSQTGDYEYIWSPKEGLNDPYLQQPTAKPVVTTKYFVSVYHPSTKCLIKDSVEIEVFPIPDVKTINDTTVCMGNSLLLNGTGADQYSWAPALYLNNPNIDNPLSSPESSIKYNLTGRTKEGCIGHDSVFISLILLPPNNLKEVDSICKWNDYLLNAQGALKYTWTDGVSSYPGNNIRVSPLQSTQYNVKLDYANGCSTEDSILVEVKEVIADFSSNITEATKGGKILFKNLTLGANKFHWFFGDKGISYQKDPEYIFNINGRFDVTLIATSPFECSDTITKNGLILINIEDKISPLSDLSMYPNPFNQIVSISQSSNRKIHIQLLDILGNIVIDDHFNNQNYQLKTHQLEPGVYFANITTDKGLSKIIKLIKNH